jgi:hypothetical protein
VASGCQSPGEEEACLAATYDYNKHLSKLTVVSIGSLRNSHSIRVNLS